MNDLHNKRCVPCEGGILPLTESEISKLHPRVEGWEVIENKKISKDFSFANFKEALGFINEIGDVAEYEGHHPDIFLHNWNKVQITLSTHSIGGLSENDFIMASKIDKVLKEMKE